MAASSSSSNSVDDAQKDLGGSGPNVLATTRTKSFNQSTLTFSGEMNPPSATYAMPSLLTSAHAAFDEDYCDSKKTLFISCSSSSLLCFPTGPASNRHWGIIPQGCGLRGGAGETSVNNGAGSWGHPPTGGWGSGGGSANPPNQVQGQWGAASSAANRGSAASQGPPGAPPLGTSVQQASNQQQPSAQQQGVWDTQKNAQVNSVQAAGTAPSQGIWANQVCASGVLCLTGVLI